MRIKKFVSTMLDGLKSDANLEVVFDVKSVESVQDTARLVDCYEDDDKLVLVFH